MTNLIRGTKLPEIVLPKTCLTTLLALWIEKLSILESESADVYFVTR